VATNGWRKNATIKGIIILKLWIVELRRTPFVVTYSRDLRHGVTQTHAAIVTVQPFEFETQGHTFLPLHFLMSFSEKCSEMFRNVPKWLTCFVCHFVLHVTVTSWSASFIHLGRAILTAYWTDGVPLTAERFYQSCKMSVFIFKCNRVMAQAVSWRPCTAEDRVRPQAYTREISGELSLEEVILRVLHLSPVSLTPTLQFTLEQAVKAQRRSRGISLLFP
jgi:hypothetical protein